MDKNPMLAYTGEAYQDEANPPGLERYTVRRDEETECHWCAGPLYVGDDAYWSEESDRVYCGAYCRDKHEAEG